MLLGVLLAAVAATLPRDAPLRVEMTLSSNTILLGEPLWVDVRVTNRSSAPLSIDMGNTCFSAKPLVIDVPDAQPRIDKGRRCGVGGGAESCISRGPQVLAPGATLSKRYVFEGAFRITQPGRYIVRLTKLLRYGPPSTPPALLPEPVPEQTALIRTTLTVEPPNPEKLLAIEQSLAARAAATMPPEQLPPHPDIETLRRAVNEYHAVAQAATEERNSIMDGITAYPAAGMEPFFASRLDTARGDYRSYQAATALFNLNTPLARAYLASAITTVPNQAAWFEIGNPGLMGDPSYIPLLERLANDSDPGTRQQAILALGTLGGESELPRLEALVTNATSEADRNNAIMALGFTATLKAVPFLLTLFQGTWESDSPPGYALFLLTHHQAHQAYVFDGGSPRVFEAEWKTWWAENQTTARAFHQWEDCPPVPLLMVAPGVT